jgi:hypothetical protein
MLGAILSYTSLVLFRNLSQLRLDYPMVIYVTANVAVPSHPCFVSESIALQFLKWEILLIPHFLMRHLYWRFLVE